MGPGLLAQAGFVHASGKELVDGAGKPLLLRGTNLGNWFEPEGYMFHLGDSAQSPREIEQLSYELIGQDSVYFPNGSPFKLNVDSVQPPIQINGAHFTITGSTLTFTSTINQSGNETINGITAPTTGMITSVITLSKQ